MRKQITHIDCSKEWQSTNDWDSHRPLLWLSLQKIDGLVIECGVGFGSTELLRKERKNMVYSFDTDKEWAGKFENVGVLSSYRSLSSIIEDEGIKRVYGDVSIIFVDGKPGEERKDVIAAFANAAKVIIAHDTEPGAEYVYGMKEILSTFKYRLDYQPEGKPHTTAVSNFVDVTKWV